MKDFRHSTGTNRKMPKKLMGKPDPLKPGLPLLMKLGSIVVHIQEFASPTGSPFDMASAIALIDNTDVQDWIKAMGVYLPKRR